jgi:hypothetical protein
MCRFLKTSRTRFHYPGQHSIHTQRTQHRQTSPGNGAKWWRRIPAKTKVSTTHHYVGWRRLRGVAETTWGGGNYVGWRRLSQSFFCLTPVFSRAWRLDRLLDPKADRHTPTSGHSISWQAHPYFWALYTYEMDIKMRSYSIYKAWHKINLIRVIVGNR